MFGQWCLVTWEDSAFAQKQNQTWTDPSMTPFHTYHHKQQHSLTVGEKSLLTSLITTNTNHQTSLSLHFLTGFIMNFVILSSSWCYTISMDIPDTFPPPFSIVNRFRWVFNATSCISTELLYVGIILSSCLCSSIWGSPNDHVTYEFVPTSPAVSRKSGSSNLDNFRDGL